MSGRATSKRVDTASCAACNKIVTVTPGTGIRRTCQECGRNWGKPRG